MKDKIWKLGREDEKESDFSLRIFITELCE